MVHGACMVVGLPGFATYVPPPAATHPPRPLPPPSFNHAAANRPSLTERAAANPCVRTSRGRAARAGRCRSERSGNAFWPPAFGTFDCSRQLSPLAAAYVPERSRLTGAAAGDLPLEGQTNGLTRCVRCFSSRTRLARSAVWRLGARPPLASRVHLGNTTRKRNYAASCRQARGELCRPPRCITSRSTTTSRRQYCGAPRGVTFRFPAQFRNFRRAGLQQAISTPACPLTTPRARAQRRRHTACLSAVGLSLGPPCALRLAARSLPIVYV